ncbi:hypothetical protein [Sphingomonas sp. Leaf10]|uniref:hypothetical protein n=1 Tax=Sphingomonas sp. Leaf10 TaxID=1735676 RepID=UPI000AA9808E|nr:hypothetical protein [Sphingomonas sp. Leaf10]
MAEDADIILRRRAAIHSMHTFAFENGWHNPPVREERRGDAIAFIGTAPDGREYAVGYEAPPHVLPSGDPFPAPPPHLAVKA